LQLTDPGHHYQSAKEIKRYSGVQRLCGVPLGGKPFDEGNCLKEAVI
jgi:hypothetical protein